MIEHLIVFKKECSQGHFFFLYSISTKFGYIINFSKRALLQDAARSIFTGKKVYCFLFTTCVGDLDGNAEFCEIAPLEVT